jgi:CBS domain-containing protein
MAMPTQTTQSSSGSRRALHLRDVMTPDPAFVSPDETIQRAAQLMDELNVGALPVCDGRRLAGMITDRDITIRCTAAGKAPEQTKVEEAMSAGTQWCTEDDDLDTAREMMAERQIRRLPVINKDEELVGIVSLGDIATKAGDAAASGETLLDVSDPAEPDR